MLVAERKLVASPPSTSRRVLVGLLVCAIVQGGLLAAFAILYVNVPPGYDVLFGLNPLSASLFREAWIYPTIPLDQRVFTLSAAVVIVLLWAVYLGANFVLSPSQGRSSPRAILGIVTVSGVLFDVGLAVLFPPVLSSDIYHYALFGRMVAFYHLNPYIVSDIAVRSDPLWQLAAWRDVTTHYGPVWTLLSAAVALVTGSGTLLTVLGFKALAALSNLLNFLLVYLLARQLNPANATRALLVYAWNPLILIETAGSGHNEAIMMTFALLGVLLLVRHRLAWGTIMLSLSVMITYLTALLAFFATVILLGQAATRRHTLKLAVRLGASAAGAIVVFYAPFWGGIQTMQELLAVGSPFKTPVRVALREIVAQILAGDTLTLASARVAAEPYVIGGLHLAFLILVLLLARGALLRAKMSPTHPWSYMLDCWGIASLIYMTVVYGWNLPFYLVIPWATVAVGPVTRINQRLNAACTGLGLAWMLVYAFLVRVG